MDYYLHKQHQIEKKFHYFQLYRSLPK